MPAPRNRAYFSVLVKDLALDLPAMMRAKEATVSQLTKGIEHLFAQNKVAHLRGTATITGPHEVSLKGDGPQEAQTIAARNIIIATGSEPAGLPNVTVDEECVLSSTGALSLQRAPGHLVVVGGGVIGLELGCVWKRLGSRVTVLEYLGNIGGTNIDGGVAAALQKILAKQGIGFGLGKRVTALRRHEQSRDGALTLDVEAADGRGAKEALSCDAVLVSVGRRAHTRDLGLQAMGIKTDEGGRVVVDGHFRTSVPSVHAIGDVIRGPMLAHRAEEEGIACVEQIASGTCHVNYDAIPSVIYTHPEVAWVGKTEEELRAAGCTDYSVGTFPFLANSRARTNQDTQGFVKVLAHRETDRILGVHIIGANAGEMIGEAVLAMEYGASSEDIARTCHAHPVRPAAFA